MSEAGEAGRDLQGKWALVTGAGRGIGQAIAKKLASLGANLLLTARSSDQLEATRESCLKLGAEVVKVYAADMAVVAQVEGMATQVLSDVGAIDILVNNAGTNSPANALEGETADMATTIEVNLVSPMRLTRHFAPGMVAKGAGTIINIGSLYSYEPHHFAGPYVASKYGLRGWSLSCHEQLREKGVKVVLISPGFVATAMAVDFPDAKPDNMIVADDVAEAAVLAVHCSDKATPTEIVLRNTKRVFGGAPPIAAV